MNTKPSKFALPKSDEARFLSAMGSHSIKETNEVAKLIDQSFAPLFETVKNQRETIEYRKEFASDLCKINGGFCETTAIFRTRQKIRTAFEELVNNSKAALKAQIKGEWANTDAILENAIAVAQKILKEWKGE